MVALRGRVEDDFELLAELIDLFLDTSPRLLAEIEAGVARRDGKTVQTAAHTLKGAMQNMGAVPGAQAALRLETIGHTGDMTLADESLVALKLEFARLESALGQVAREVQA